jgi:hypothetical protein
MRILVIVAALIISGCAASRNREFSYNYEENRMESVSPGDRLTYNIHENEWQYAAPGAKPTFNYYENRWELKK